MRIESFRTKYCDGPAEVLRGHYSVDGSTALMVFSEEGEPLCTPTVCMIDSDQRPTNGNVFIKTYADNEGVLEALQAAGVVGEPLRWMDAGYVHNGVAEVPLIAEVEEA